VQTRQRYVVPGECTHWFAFVDASYAPAISADDAQLVAQSIDDLGSPRPSATPAPIKAQSGSYHSGGTTKRMVRTSG